MILSVRKGATAPFSCLPARMGSGKARNRVKGLVPCGFLGQRPKPSESFSESISTVFKVHLSLFFAAQFFINYLTLPNRYISQMQFYLIGVKPKLKSELLFPAFSTLPFSVSTGKSLSRLSNDSSPYGCISASEPCAIKL